MRFRRLSFPLLLGMASVWASVAQTSAPAALTAQPTFAKVRESATPTPQDALLVELQNNSNKRIRGYVFQIVFLGADGKTIQTFTRSGLKSERDGTPTYIEPGAVSKTLPIGRPMVNGQLADYKLSLDLVLFEDGSRWGPQALPESQKFLGYVEGVDRTRKQAAH
ncbi:MAG TPA: hypothetical protein VG675_24485 [Bryobacteraceae bacterium]|nr:hypothetical protein [Bryobacteraceae bacterium]